MPRQTDRLAGDRVDCSQMGHLMACQDPPDRGRIQAEFGGQDNGTTPTAAPGGEHLLLDAAADVLGHPDRPRAAISQRLQTAFGISTQPLVDRCPGNAQLLSNIRGRLTSSDTLNDQASSGNIGAGVSVRHEDLLRVNARHIHSVRRSSPFQAGTPSTTSHVTTTRPRLG